MKRLHSIEVQGREHTWSFEMYGTDEYVRAWRDDGLSVEMVTNTVPVWMPARLVRAWVFLQDLFYFRNPFK